MATERPLPTPGVPPFRNPLEHLSHDLQEIITRAHRHWGSVTLAAATIGGAAYVAYLLNKPYTPDTQVKTTAPVSDTFKPADPGSDSEVVVPAISTETPTPAATATATAEPTKAPPKEKPSSLTAANFNEFVGRVSQEEFQKLAKAQPDAFAFPVKSGEDFTITYKDNSTTSPSAKSNYKSINITGSKIKLVVPTGGDMHFEYNDRQNRDKITNIKISKKLSEDTTMEVNIVIPISTASGSSIVPAINNDQQVEKGVSLAEINGTVAINISLFQKLSQPIVINRPDGGQTEILAYVTYLTPSVFENSGWISQNGKAVTSQN